MVGKNTAALDEPELGVGIFNVVPESVAAPVPVVVKVSGAC